MHKFAYVSVALALASPLAGCTKDVGALFDRPDPAVERARAELDASYSDADADLQAGRLALEELTRFRCDQDGGRDLVIDRPFASLDLGLVLFRIAELVGQRFGEEDVDGGEEAEAVAQQRAKELDCAKVLLGRLAHDASTPPRLAAQARYLLGNFAFLARRYRDAVSAYDEVLLAHPARGLDSLADGGAPADDDEVARAAAWNRAIALRRIEDEKDAGADSAPPDASQDAPSDGAGEGGSDDGGNGKQEGGAQPDAGAGESGTEDAASDTGPGPSDASNPPEQDAASQPPPPAPSAAPSTMASSGVDLRQLDRYDQKAPLDLDLPARMRERRRIPRSRDK